MEYIIAFIIVILVLLCLHLWLRNDFYKSEAKYWKEVAEVREGFINEHIFKIKQHDRHTEKD